MKYRFLVLIFLFILSLSLASCSSIPDILSSERAITAFTFPSISTATTIDEGNHTITVTVPFDIDVEHLIATFTASAGASVSVGSTVQQSGITPNNFTNPVVYRVTSAFGWIQDYTVNVTVAVQTSDLTKTVELSGGAGVGTMPFGALPLREMLLYRASEMKGAGTITSISFKYYDIATSAVSCPNVTIKMWHTYQSVFPETVPPNGDFASNINTGQGSQQTVRNNTTVNIPSGTAGAYYKIRLTTPYNYNGVDNLVVEITRPACTGDVRTASHRYAGSDGIDIFNQTDAAATEGEVGPWLPDTKFTLSGGDSLVGATIGGRVAPFTTSVDDQKVQLLYGKDEINGSGIITGIALVADLPTTTERTYTMNVKLGHTNLSALTTTFANNFNVNAPVTVASAVNFTVPAGIPVGGYLWVPLPTASFDYNGTDNLVVEIAVTAASGESGGQWGWFSSAGTRLYAGNAASTGTVDDSHYMINFRFAGGPVDVITQGGSSDASPFGNSGTGSIRQILYLASELGAKGTITKVAHRLSSDSIAGNYGSFTIKLANTDITTLSTTFANNIPGATTVYSSTYLIPLGLKAGDWIEIPLTTPFAIDPTKNLIVEMSDSSGDADNSNLLENSATRYISRRAYATPVATTGLVSNHLADLRLIMQ